MKQDRVDCGPSLPCPFCGGGSQIVQFRKFEHTSDFHPKWTWWRVVCVCCSANSGKRSTKNEAINVWEARQ